MRAAQESAHFSQGDETAVKVDRCYCRVTTLLWIIAVVLALIIGGAIGGFKVYKQGPGFLGLVPAEYGSDSYGSIVECMDKHARGELHWQERAIIAENTVETCANDHAMKQFAFALAHDSAKALAAGCEAIPFDDWNEAFRGGFIDTIVAAGNTRCVDWIKTNATIALLAEREIEKLTQYQRSMVCRSKSCDNANLVKHYETMILRSLEETALRETKKNPSEVAGQ